MASEEAKSTLEFLYNVSRELASALDLRTVLQRILFQSLKYVGGERASIVVLDDNGKAIDSAIVYGRKIHDHTTQQLRQWNAALQGGSSATASQPGCRIQAGTKDGCAVRMMPSTNLVQKPRFVYP
jgi:nitrate/nitrite-specific signal transduction histidine kinase